MVRCSRKRSGGKGNSLEGNASRRARAIVQYEAQGSDSATHQAHEGVTKYHFSPGADQQAEQNGSSAGGSDCVLPGHLQRSTAERQNRGDIAGQ